MNDTVRTMSRPAPGGGPGPRTLWDFEQALVDAMDELSDLIPAEGEVETDEQRDRRVVLEGKLTQLIQRESDKVDGTYRLFKRFDRYIEELEQDAKDVNARIKKFTNDRKRLAQYLIDVMIAWGAKKLEGRQGTLTRIQNAETLDVERPQDLPFEFQRWEFTIKPRTQAELDKVRDLLGDFVDMRFTVDPDKPTIKKHLAKVETALEQAMHDGVVVGHTVDMPGGVLLKPGTWRLAVKP